MGKTLNIAHRGGAALKPENTLAAFTNAIATGCDGAELDVQLSADGVVVVHHDFRLNPAVTRHAGGWLSGTTPCIKDLSLAALQSYDVGRPDPASEYTFAHPRLSPVEGERIPTLEAVVARAGSARSPFWLFVELKSSDHPDSGDPISLADETLAVMESYLDLTVFVGFDWRGLRRIKHHTPSARCWFTTDRLEADIKPILQGLKQSGADGWFGEWDNVTRETVNYAREIGLEVGAWTANEPPIMKKLAALKLDAVCTDRPDLLKNLIAG